MAKQRVLKPEPLTKTVTIKDVPSEVAELFNALCVGGNTPRKTRLELFQEMVLNHSKSRFGEEITARRLRDYCCEREEWNLLVARRLRRELDKN